ncbi:MAG: dynamin family protein [Deltaproteobacteria bacterium]|nr:dynamin family protein [Deltaproteobacteria bacterium]
MGLAPRDANLDRLSDNFEPFLNRIQEICNQLHIISLNRQIEACRNLLDQNELIDVAVLGQFKAGKSSFLNSLIGKLVLPVGVIPVTTAITRLQYGEEERAIIRHVDGRHTETDISAIGEFISEAQNSGNHKHVEVVDLELPSLSKYVGLRLVDTPGLGSVYKDHIKTSENWLPEVGTAVLAISADRPLAENDMQLLRELRQHTPKIVLLLTKADLLTPEQQEEVVHFFRSALQREFQEQFPIFLYSTRQETERWKQTLEKEVLQPLSLNREEELGEILLYKMKSLVMGCLSYLAIALKTSRQADRDREQCRTQILDEKVNYELFREGIELSARENTQQTRGQISSYLEKFHEPGLKNKTRERLRKELPSWRGNLWKLTRRYEEWLRETLAGELDHISRTERERFLGTLKKTHTSFSRSLEVFRSLLNQNLEKTLGLRLAEVDWKIDVAEPQHPDVRTVRTFDQHFDLIWFLIPMPVFRPLVERHFLNQIPREVMVNLSRLAAQWEKLINRAINEMKDQTLKYVRDELATIESLLSRSHDQTEELKRAIEELEEQLEQMAMSNRHNTAVNRVHGEGCEVRDEEYC